MVGCCHRLNGHEFGYILGAGVGQGDLACCGPWGAELDMTNRVNWTELNASFSPSAYLGIFLEDWINTSNG